MNVCGCTAMMGFEKTFETLMSLYNIEPWEAKRMIRMNLDRQLELSRRSPLRQIHVIDGLHFLRTKFRSKFGRFGSVTLSREQFLQGCVEMMSLQQVSYTQKDINVLNEVFDSMDFDANGSLTMGEWSGGLSVFLSGSVEECIHAVFDTLDKNGSKSLSKSELQEYLTPYVKAMTPPSAEVLRPILLKQAVEDIYNEMNLDHVNDISAQEMLIWTQRGNNLIDRLALLIDQEVYAYQHKLKKGQNAGWRARHAQNNLFGGKFDAGVRPGEFDRQDLRDPRLDSMHASRYGDDQYGHSPGRRNRYDADRDRGYDEAPYDRSPGGGHRSGSYGGVSYGSAYGEPSGYAGRDSYPGSETYAGRSPYRDPRDSRDSYPDRGGFQDQYDSRSRFRDDHISGPSSSYDPFATGRHEMPPPPPPARRGPTSPSRSLQKGGYADSGYGSGYGGF